MELEESLIEPEYDEEQKQQMDALEFEDKPGNATVISVTTAKVIPFKQRMGHNKSQTNLGQPPQS